MNGLKCTGNVKRVFAAATVGMWVLASFGCVESRTDKPDARGTALQREPLDNVTAKNRWLAARTEQERRDACISMIDSRILVNHQDVNVLKRIFGDDFDVLEEAADGAGVAMVHFRPEQERPVVGWNALATGFCGFGILIGSARLSIGGGRLRNTTFRTGRAKMLLARCSK